MALCGVAFVWLFRVCLADTANFLACQPSRQWWKSVPGFLVNLKPVTPCTCLQTRPTHLRRPCRSWVSSPKVRMFLSQWWEMPGLLECSSWRPQPGGVLKRLIVIRTHVLIVLAYPTDKLGVYSSNNVEHMLTLKAVDVISAVVGGWDLMVPVLAQRSGERGASLVGMCLTGFCS